MNEKPEIEVGKLPVITKFIYTLGVLPTSYLMSMTYQEQVTWLYNYLQTQVIPLLNTESAAVQELQTLYELLRTYVNDYFDNLDVQEEINNKINEMFESGYLPQLIQNYVNELYVPFQEDLESYKQVINNDLLSMNNKIDNVISDRPIVVSSTSGMTDTTKIYINTSDNKWYYYNGTTWTIGGDYPGTSFSNDSITNNMIASVNYSKVIKDSLKNDFSDVTSWKNSVVVGGYRTVSVDNTGLTDVPAGAITPDLPIDKTKDLYVYVNISGTGTGAIYICDENTIRKRFITSYPIETNRTIYVKLTSDYLQTLNTNHIRFRFIGMDNGAVTFSNIIINQYDFLKLADNLTNALGKTYYNNFTNNMIDTNIQNWSFKYNESYLHQHTIDSFGIVYFVNTDQYSGWKSPDSINFDGYLKVSFDCVVPEGLNTSIYMINSSNAFVRLDLNIASGHHEYNVDLAYYSVYHGFSDWAFMISSGKVNATDNLVLEITNFRFYVSKISNLEIYDNNFENMIANIGNKLTRVNQNTEVKSYISNGTEKCIVRSNNSGMVAVPVVPTKTLIIGNSLLLGNTHNEYSFGMASSNIESDYFYHLSSYITSIKPSATFAKKHGRPFEDSTNDTMYNSFISELNPYLSNDLDLVIIQLGDNVNTTEKVNYFRNSCKNLVQYISSQCPNARIVWVGMWYSSTTCLNIINKMIFETGTEFINIQDIRNTNTESAIGNTITYPDGYTTTITNSGVASHPGDLGMERIANRILFKLGIKETE